MNTSTVVDLSLLDQMINETEEPSRVLDAVISTVFTSSGDIAWTINDVKAWIKQGVAFSSYTSDPTTIFGLLEKRFAELPFQLNDNRWIGIGQWRAVVGVSSGTAETMPFAILRAMVKEAMRTNGLCPKCKGVGMVPKQCMQNEWEEPCPVCQGDK
jgi:hypothetical protein